MARIRSEAGSVHNEKVFDVVALLELVEDGFLRVGAHARDAGFMKGPARSRRMSVCADVLGAGGFEHLTGGIAHVLDHGAFVFAVGHVNFEDGDPIDVFHTRVEFDEIVKAREDFAEAGDFDVCAGFAQSLLSADP